MAEKNYTIYTIIFSLFNQQYYSMWLPLEAVVFTQTLSLINGSIRVDPLGLVLPFSLDNNLRSVTRDRGTTEKPFVFIGRSRKFSRFSRHPYFLCVQSTC